MRWRSPITIITQVSNGVIPQRPLSMQDWFDLISSGLKDLTGWTAVTGVSSSNASNYPPSPDWVCHCHFDWARLSRTIRWVSEQRVIIIPMNQNISGLYERATVKATRAKGKGAYPRTRVKSLTDQKRPFPQLPLE